MARKKTKKKNRPDDVPQVDTPATAPSSQAVSPDTTSNDTWPADDMQKFSYLLFFVAAVLLVNSLEPDMKGNTGTAGVVVLVVASALFAIARKRSP